MARTIQEIYDSIIAEKETKATLAGLLPAGDTAENLLDQLTSNSKVAVWRLWAFIIAVAIHTHELLWDIFKQEIQAIAAAAPAGTPAWYVKKCFEFQFGDILQYINNQYVYDPVDSTKQIIKRAAIEERADGVVVVKVAKLVSGSPVELSTPEKDAFTSYMQDIKFAGTRLAVISIPGDELNLVWNIRYDPQIPLSQVQLDVANALDTYIANLPFNAAVNVNRINDALQGVPGVVDPVFISATGTPQGGGPTPFNVSYIPAAGWVVLNPAIAISFTWTAV